MRFIHGFKVGGLQQKVFNLLLSFIIVLVGSYVAVGVYQQRNLSATVQEASVEQQASIESVSEETMEAMLESAMVRSTALQAYIADDLFSDVRADVLTLHSFAGELLEHADGFPDHLVAPPSRENDGVPSAQLVCEEGVDPADSELIGLIGNMSELMLSMYTSSDKLNSVFVGTADGLMVLVNDRSAVFTNEDGTPRTLDIRNRPWYRRAAEAEPGEAVFTGVELDAYTDSPMLECAAPIYRDGELVAVVAADVYLSAISDYVDATSTDGGFLCVVNEDGQVLFSPRTDGAFRALPSAEAPDLRLHEDQELAAFVSRALNENTGLRQLNTDGKSYYITGAPMPTVGWAVISAVDQELTRQPAENLLSRYDSINAAALSSYEQGARRSAQTFVTLTAVIILLALIGALVLAGRMVRPIERMTWRINALSGSEATFEMEDAYRTGDEIEVLAESFATLSKRTRDYIAQITRITAEKERIGTELALATRIQADMLPNIYPAFPDRPEFDIYATMDPAKEVGGDFYDFFLIDDTHLGIVMADVSGKGIPAALFMMVSRILVQNYAMSGRSPARVLEAVNNQICANNREEMFVTVWFGVLDTETGELTAANAGHEYPVLMGAGGEYELVKDRHGFVIGGMDGIRYKEYTLKLTPGSRLFLYTDGVPEATNADNELFGTDRMLAALNADLSATPLEMLENVRRAVDGFVRDAEQFDDMTMLGLEYNGGQQGGTEDV